MLDLDDYVDHIFVEIRKPLLTYTVWWTTNLHQYHKHTYVGSNGVLAWPRASLRQVLFEIDEPVTGIHLRGAATIDPHKLYLIDQSQRVKPLTRHTAQIPPANVFNLAAQNPVARQLRPPTPSRHEYDMTRITASGRLYDRVGNQHSNRVVEYDDGFYTEDVDWVKSIPRTNGASSRSRGRPRINSVLSLSLVDGHLVADFGDRVYSVKK